MVSIRSALVIASVAVMATASAFHADSHHRTLQAVNFRQELLDEINAVRKTHKLPDLCINNQLMYAAQDHANDMAENNFVNSTSPDGSTPKDRALISGFKADDVTETVGGGFRTVATIVAAWAKTNSAQSTLLSDCNVMGPGYAFDRTKKLVHFWAVDFSTGACGDGKAKGNPTSPSNRADDDAGPGPKDDAGPEPKDDDGPEPKDDDGPEPKDDDKKKKKSSDSSGDSDEKKPLPAPPPAEDTKTPADSPPVVDDKTRSGGSGSAPVIPTKPADLKTPINPGTVHAAPGDPPAPPPEAPATDPPATEEEARSNESPPKPVTPVVLDDTKPTVPVVPAGTPKDSTGAKPTAPGGPPLAAAPLAVDSATPTDVLIT